ncbi:MAG: hypothetical protein HY822_24820 [Acidobacteria bacterium]|nr:hypothetical protein [Acidobacteriota bacterium]
MALLFATLSGAAAAHAETQTTFDFMNLTDGTPVTTQFKNRGVVFSSSINGGPMVYVAEPNPDPRRYPGQLHTLCMGPPRPGWGGCRVDEGDITLTFQSPARSLSSEFAGVLPPGFPYNGNDFGGSLPQTAVTLTVFGPNGETQSKKFIGYYDSPDWMVWQFDWKWWHSPFYRMSGNLSITPPFDIVKATFKGTSFELIDVTFGGVCVRLRKPAEDKTFHLSESNYTTANVVFNASGLADKIDWRGNVKYRTIVSPNFYANHDFTSAPGLDQTETFAGVGGQFMAEVSVAGCPDKKPLEFTIAGAQISAGSVTDRLLSLYTGGTTPRLLTGFAMVESTYQHFLRQTRYNVADYWPHESYDGGSHIGLMQMPVSMQMAFDWLANTQGAAALFQQKLSAAARLETRIRKTRTGLRELTALERENMAILLYGPGASAALTEQYYAPVCVGGTVVQSECRGGVWNWVVNAAGNAKGAAYVQKVRASIQ